MKNIPYLDLIKKAVLACEYAIAPYSHFKVGASLLTATGLMFTGCNIECSSFGLTICAERVSLFKALSEGHSEFVALAIYAKEKPFCPPCGACLQVINDYAKGVSILLTDGENFKEYTLSDMLPVDFNVTHLKHND
jgi:cytidine deaminase